MKVLTDTGLAYFHSKLQDEFVSQSSFNGAIDDYLDNYFENIDWTEAIGDAYATSEDVEDMISSADLDNYLPLSGGTMTGELKIGGTTTPLTLNTTGTNYRDIQCFSTDGNHRIGVIRFQKDSNNNCTLTLGVNNTNNDAPSGISLSRSTSSTVAKVGSNTIATFDSNNKLVFPNGNTLWFA